MWWLFFVFLSYLARLSVKGDLGRGLDAGKESKEIFSTLNGTFCAKVSIVRENYFYQVSDGADVAQSVVGPDGKAVNCSVTLDPVHVSSFMRECQLGLAARRAGLRADARFARLDGAARMCREFGERTERSGGWAEERKGGGDAALRDKVLKRAKRGFTYPGTLWCGAGNMADRYDQLGEFAETDSCCRIHDHCPHVIHAFSSNYGYTNFKWHSICHCDCDNTLKACLRNVNDTSSRVVGQAFFNVIGVPCFEFVYEERCAERHWYGMCKRYEELPIAVVKDAVPYDFGGIDVIDELPLSPPKKTDSKKKEEANVVESTTQATMSGPNEPSLRNVVTAAEDFIKVLATVSTSQSSTSDSDKGETQSSEKKKRKNAGKRKKTSKKRKGKGKGRKRKQKAQAGVKIEEGATVSTSGSKTEEVALSNFIMESRKHEQVSRNADSVSDSGYELGGREEPSNEVMKDEPAVDKETVSITSAASVQKKTGSAEEIILSTSVIKTRVQHKAKTRRLREGGRKKNKTMSLSSSEELQMNTEYISVPVAAQSQQQSYTEPVISTASTPIVSAKLKRNRSKERGDGEGREKRRKDSLASPIVAPPRENSSVGNLRVIPLTASPTELSVPSTGQRVSPGLDINVGKRVVQNMSLNPSYSVQKRQKLQRKGLRGNRRKPVLPLSSENPLHLNSSENVLTVLPKPETRNALVGLTPVAVISSRTEETRNEGSVSTAVAVASSVITKRHRQTISQQRKSRRKALPAVLRNGVSSLKHTELTPMTFTAKPPKTATTEELNLQRSKTTMTTSAAPVMSPIQLSIERVKAQFSRKKRRKAALSVG